MPNFQPQISRPAKKIRKYDPYSRYTMENGSKYIHIVDRADKNQSSCHKNSQIKKEYVKGSEKMLSV